MQLHFKSNEGEEGITRTLPGNDLHRFGSSFEFFVKPFDDVCGPERNPFLLREVEESEAGIKGFFQVVGGFLGEPTFKGKAPFFLPFPGFWKFTQKILHYLMRHTGSMFAFWHGLIDEFRELE